MLRSRDKEEVQLLEELAPRAGSLPPGVHSLPARHMRALFCCDLGEKDGLSARR